MIMFAIAVRVSLIALVILPSLCFGVAKAQDSNGDYFPDSLPTQDGEYLHSEWKVVSPRLVCHMRADETSRPLWNFEKNDTFTVPTSLGRMANINPVYLSPDELPWMIVTGSNRRGFTNGGVCFVRANAKLIVPDDSPIIRGLY